MTSTLRIAARDVPSAGLVTSAWRRQGGCKPSSLMPAAASHGGNGGKGQPCVQAGAAFGNAPRHEIDTPIYREIAM